MRSVISANLFYCSRGPTPARSRCGARRLAIATPTRLPRWGPRFATPTRLPRWGPRFLARAAAAVEEPLHRPAGQSHERFVHHLTIEPKVDGDDRGRNHPARPGQRLAQRGEVSVEELWSREPRHCRHNRAGCPAFARSLDRRHFTPIDAHLRRRCGPDRAAAPLDILARGLRVHHVQRLDREPNRGGSRIGPKHLRQHAREHWRRRVRRWLIERGKRQRIPQHLANPSGLSVAYQPTLDRLARRRRNSPRAGLARAPREARTRLSFVLRLSKGKAKWRGHPQYRS